MLRFGNGTKFQSFRRSTSVTLGYEQAQKEERLEEALSKGAATTQLHDEGYANASDEDVKSRIASLKASVGLQYSAAKCIKTDDPCLKEK
jgi:hypothetical protein